MAAGVEAPYGTADTAALTPAAAPGTNAPLAHTVAAPSVSVREDGATAGGKGMTTVATEPTGTVTFRLKPARAAVALVLRHATATSPRTVSREPLPKGTDGWSVTAGHACTWA